MASILAIATMARNLVSERSPAAVSVTIPHIQALIPVALEMWVHTVMLDPEKLPFLENTYTANLVNGTLDMSGYFDGSTATISPESLQNRPVYASLDGIRTPFTWLSSYSQLANSRIPTDIPAVYLDGNTLRTRNDDGSLTSLGTTEIEFTALTYPSDATAIPTMLVGEFVTFLAAMVVKSLAVDGPARPR